VYYIVSIINNYKVNYISMHEFADTKL